MPIAKGPSLSPSRRPLASLWPLWLFTLERTETGGERNGITPEPSGAVTCSTKRRPWWFLETSLMR